MNSNDVSYFSWADGCVLEIWGEKVIINALNDIWIALRAFDEQALTFASIATGIYLLVIIFINIIRRIRNKKPDSLLVCMQKVFVFAVFMVYMSYLISLTLSGREAGSRSNKVNLLLFGTFRKDGSLSRQSVENVLLFVPFGILVPMFTRLFRRWWNLVLMAFAGSLFIETTQLITARGYFELDDIVFNTFGAFLGYIVFSICYHSLIAIKRETKIPLNKHEVQINRVTLFLIQLLPVIFMICLIFSFSADNAEESSELSLFVTEKLLYIVNKLFRIGMTAEKIENKVVEVEGSVRTLAHMIEFATLTFFTFVFLYCRKIKNYLSFILSFVLVGIIAVMDEASQNYSIGRNASIGDVCVDMFAASVVLFIMLIVLSVLRFYHAGGKIRHLLFDND